jgi:hypothetical protein
VAASPACGSLVDVCAGVDDITIVYRNHRDILDRC